MSFKHTAISIRPFKGHKLLYFFYLNFIDLITLNVFIIQLQPKNSVTDTYRYRQALMVLFHA